MTERGELGKALPSRVVGIVALLSALLTVSAVSAQPATQHFAEGLARLQAGEAAAAILSLEAALTANPVLRDAYPALVVAHLQAGEPQQADVVAAQGLERFPGDLHLTQLRAEASLQQGEVEAALPLYRVVHEAVEAGRSVPNVTAAQVRERLVTVLQHAGGRAYEQGRRADAVAHYREARSLAPADEGIREALLGEERARVGQSHVEVGRRPCVQGRVGIERFIGTAETTECGGLAAEEARAAR
ncbi:MAG: hypothetical protein AAGN64_16280 [Bacteroidota bacterium]